MIHPTIDMMWTDSWYSVFLQTLNTTAVGVATLSRRLSLRLTLTAVAVGHVAYNFLVRLFVGVAGVTNQIQTDDEDLN